MARGDRHPAHGAAGRHRQDETPPTLSSEQETAVEGLLGEVPALAAALTSAESGGREALAGALGRVEQVDEAAALVFATRLAQVRGTDGEAAANVAAALGDLDPRKEVAREARRSRLRLRSAGYAPTLTIPPAPPVVPSTRLLPPDEASTDRSAQAAASTASEAGSQPAPIPLRPSTPRLAEAFATRTRESGEMTLILGWQEGSNADQLRAYLVSLDFAHAGISRFVVSDILTRKQFQRDLVDRAKSEGVSLVTITWAQARALLREALSVAEWRGEELPAEFTEHREQIEARLLVEPGEGGEQERETIEAEDDRRAREGDRPFIGNDMNADETVANWIGAWSYGDFGLAYDLLADDNAVRRTNSREDYIASRRQWADEAKPGSLRLGIVREQERRASALWVPGAPAGGLGSGKDLEAFWSLVLEDSPLGGAFEELPMATLISAESGRHWYWTGYTVQHERAFGLWTISRFRDEGKASQALTIDELQKRIKDAHDQAEQIANTTEAAQSARGPKAEQALIEGARQLTATMSAALHYDDALLVRLPLDETAYQSAIDDARVLNNHERAAALLERMVARFGEKTRLRFELGISQYLTAETYGQQGQPATATEWLERAITTLAQVADDEPTVQHLQALGEILARRGHMNQAEARLRQALEVAPDSATVHADLASVLMAQTTGENLEGLGDEVEGVVPSEEERNRLARAALAELREAARLDNTVPHLYTRMGAIYDLLGQKEDARIALEEAVSKDPGDAEAAYALGSLLLSNSQPQEALPHLEHAVELEPLAVSFRLNLALAYASINRRREAERELNLIDRLQPGLPQVAEVRAILAQSGKK